MWLWELVEKSELDADRIWGSSARRLRLNPGEYVLNYVHNNKEISTPRVTKNKVCKSNTSQLLAKSGIVCIWMSAQHLQRQKLASSSLNSEDFASLLLLHSVSPNNQ